MHDDFQLAVQPSNSVRTVQLLYPDTETQHERGPLWEMFVSLVIPTADAEDSASQVNFSCSRLVARKERTDEAAADVATYQSCAVRSAPQNGQIFARGRNKTLKAQ